jgi:Flp pilus assembly protein TadD
MKEFTHPPASVPSTVASACGQSQRTWRRNRIIFAILGGALTVVILVVLWPRTKPNSPPLPEPELGDDLVDDPRLTCATPFQNVRPEVQYVGDDACAGCHRRESKGFHQHPMGLSLLPIAAVAATQRYEPEVHNPFDYAGVRYLIERLGDRVRHKEIWPNARGKPLLATEHDMVYAIGSGAQAVSYLFLKGDYLFQSPISWYVRQHRWSLSPGFEGRGERFGRPVLEECLFCHSNPVQAVKDTTNRFAQPLFPHGLSIGCERCHGPGQLHVQERRAQQEIVGGVDHSIVNPRHLAPQLREAICYQCHLEGERRVLRRGRQPFDYRPGLPLELFWTVFLPAPDLSDAGKFVGQVEQLQASHCFVRSKGRMGCSTCHDAHDQPAVAARPAWYRQRCLECHQDQGCTLALAKGRKQNGDNCVACHMPRRDSTEIMHTASTDHRILRQPEPESQPAPRKLRWGEVPLVDTFGRRPPPPESEEGRDVGMALASLAELESPVLEQLGATALPYLEAAVRRGPRDVPAAEACAYCLNTQRRHHEALAVLETVLARSPDREKSVADAALYAARDGQLEKSIAYWRRAIALNPWRSEYRQGFIETLHKHHDHDEALTQCQEVLEFHPSSVPIRTLLVASYLAIGQRDKAQAEFDTLWQLSPPKKEELRRWYERQRRR